jgi:large conductance mechanosensitive channel
MSVIKEFTAFIKKGNVVDLAVAVVVGGAFGKIVSAVVADLVMPLINAVTPQGDWRKWEVSPLHFRVGDFLGTVVDFVIVAFVIFLVMVKMVGMAARRDAAATPPPPPTKPCPECLETVPVAARRCRACTSLLTALALLFLLAGRASAQTDPKFAFVKADDVKPAAPAVEWKAQMRGGLIVTSGNSQATNVALGLLASRKAAGNKLSLEGGLAYGRSSVIAPVLDATGTTITGFDRQSQVTTNNWFAKGRYDRFFTPNNSGYAAALAAADQIAGKSFAGGGQAGYSRQVLKTYHHLLVAEIGYDFSDERYLQQPNRTFDPVVIHSARLFVGETLKLTPQTGAFASVEAFFNLNDEGKAIDVNNGMLGVKAFHDTRVIGKLGFSTTVWKSLSAALSFIVRYDQNPAPLPPPLGSPSIGGATSFLPFAEKTDTTTEVSLIYTLL